MTFQFLCPQGHLLQGEEAHMGMQCQCPQCGTAFIIPTIDRPQQSAVSAVDFDLAPIDELDTPGRRPAPPARESAPPNFSSHGRGGPEFHNLNAPDPEFDESVGDDLSDEMGELSDDVGEVLLHIPCPNGHVLDVTLDMIGARAMCPHCRAEFRLRREKSEEYIREQEMLDAKRAQFWIRLAIIAAGVVVIVLLVMILATSLS